MSKSTPLFGAHMSIAGGVSKALERGASIGCRVVQIFTRNQTRWSSPPYDPEEVERFRKLAPGFASVFAHSSYLINLASPDEALWTRSAAALAEELKRCLFLGLPMLVLHPGSHMGSGKEAGIRRVVAGLARAVAESRTAASATAAAVEILLETTSGQGSVLGSRFEELRDLLDGTEAAGLKVGVCADTCHLFAAGYDLRRPEAFKRTWEAFDRVIGRPFLKVVHLNDSLHPLGSGKDRHAHIGAGAIGLEGFRLLVRDPALQGLPMCLETPKGKDLAEDVMNLRVLEELTLRGSGPGRRRSGRSRL